MLRSDLRVRIPKRALVAASTMMLLGLGVSLAIGCSSTQFYNEGPGQPEDRASGTVPTGMIGVCKRPFSKRPPIVDEALWENARVCSASTPKNFVRLGYGHERTGGDQSRKVERMMEALREGPRIDGGNTKVLSMLRTIRAEGQSDPWLRDRVREESARTSVCDVTYLLNTMEQESARLRRGDRCAVRAYDQKQRKEVCLFDTSLEEAVWLTSAWACTARTEYTQKPESCHRLCAYDDYCARQVSCAAPDIDLALCAMGVCLPEPDPI